MSIPWQNDVGNYRYQPLAFDGEALWRTTAGDVWDYFDDNYGCLGPRLYRSEARADRVGRRRDKILRTRVFRSVTPPGEEK